MNRASNVRARPPIPRGQARDAPAVLVTGASTGIGRACALRLDRRGYVVFAGVRRDVDADRLRGVASRRLQPVLLDVTDRAAIAAVADDIGAAVGGRGLAGLVHGAGIGVGGPIEFPDLGAWRLQFEVSVFGTVAVTAALMPLIRDGGGRIVLIGSTAGFLPTPFLGPYSAAKAAQEATGRCLRMELAPWGIPVSIIDPGMIDTPLLDKSLEGVDRAFAEAPPTAQERYRTAHASLQAFFRQAQQRAIPAEHVAAAVQRALESRRPRTRYLVGTDARVQALVSLLPDRLADRLILRLMDLPSAG